jgi:hypothetical protein
MKAFIMKILFAAFATSAFAQQNITSRGSRPVRISEVHTAEDGTNIMTSLNWAGSAVGPPGPETSFYAVVATLNAPHPKLLSGAAPGVYGGSAWVGIDGMSPEDNSILQAGIEWILNVDANGSYTTTWNAWYEWLPLPQTNFNNFAISAGDTITVLCQSRNSSYGVCGVQNHNTGVTVKEIMVPPSDEYFLVGHTAEWIVEDFMLDGSLVPFPDFGKVEWYNCEAAAAQVGVATGKTTMFSPGADTFILHNSTMNLTSTTTSGKNMTVTYIG